MKNDKFKETLLGPLNKNNPVVVQVLGICSTAPGQKETPHGRCRQISNLHDLAGGSPIPNRCASNFRRAGGLRLKREQYFGVP